MDIYVLVKKSATMAEPVGLLLVRGDIEEKVPAAAHDGLLIRLIVDHFSLLAPGR